jgi:hypothetical protein
MFCSIVGGILLVGGLYSMLWSKNSEEAQMTTAATDHEEYSREVKEKVVDRRNDLKMVDEPASAPDSQV